jgi:hypothetical protein
MYHVVRRPAQFPPVAARAWRAALAWGCPYSSCQYELWVIPLISKTPPGGGVGVGEGADGPEEEPPHAISSKSRLEARARRVLTAAPCE